MYKKKKKEKKRKKRKERKNYRWMCARGEKTPPERGKKYMGRVNTPRVVIAYVCQPCGTGLRHSTMCPVENGQTWWS
jgi:hypothetical protein